MIEKKKVDNVVEIFIKGLEVIEEQTKEKEKEFEKQILQTKEIEKQLKEEYAQNKKGLEAEKLKTQTEQQKLIDLQGQVNTELAKYQVLLTEANADRQTAEQIKKDTEIERNFASEELIKQKKITQDFLNKTNALKEDFDRLEKAQKKLIEDTKQIENREKNTLKREATITEREQKIYERELDTDLKEKAIKIEQKKIKLKT